jgi:hypothetical protein
MVRIKQALMTNWLIDWLIDWLVIVGMDILNEIPVMTSSTWTLDKVVGRALAVVSLFKGLGRLAFSSSREEQQNILLQTLLCSYWFGRDPFSLSTERWTPRRCDGIIYALPLASTQLPLGPKNGFKHENMGD